jgi:HK97 gp10 family phage protein
MKPWEKGMDLSVDGADALSKLMRKFPERIRRDIINSAAARVATVVKQRAKRNLKQNGSFESGTLWRSIKTRKKKGTHGIYHIYIADEGWYWYFVENGHAGTKLAKPVRYEFRPGEWRMVGRTGTAPAKPFFRPAMEDDKTGLLIEIQKRMAKRMAAEAEKMTKEYRTLSKSYRKKLAK